MAWSQKIAGRRFAIDGQLANVIAGLQAVPRTPAARQSIKTSTDAALALVRDAPIDCDVYVRLAGGVDNAGSGNVVLVFATRPHQNPGEGFDPEATTPL